MRSLGILLLAAAPLAAQPVSKDAPARPDFRLGVEVLLEDSLGLLRGKRVGLITNHTGRDRAGTSTIDLLARAPGVRLVALFAPEHGIRGQAEAGARIGAGVDSATGVPIRSLYGATQASRVPTPAMLADVDVLVYDIQDVGSRAYTYVWTMALAAEAAGKVGKKFVVLDRPNPIRADIVEGGVLRTEWRSFTGQYPVTLRYGLTPGEMLRYLVGTGQVKADFAVVPMRGYRRADWWEDTGLAWVNPSPNIRDAEAALLYAGTVFFEAVNVSEGRGTATPFKAVGAPWLTDAAEVAREMDALALPGVRFAAATRVVAAGSEHGGRTIPVVELRVTDRDRIRPVEVAAHLLAAIRRRHPREWRWQENGMERLSGSRALRRAIEGDSVAALMTTWRREAAEWQASTRPYWLYR